jgi:hypothetical protein
MKKLSFILLLTITISSCMVQTRNYNLGMSETEFTSKDKWLISVAEKSTERTVYKKITGQEHNHYTYLYYYFVDGKLVRIDEGEKQPNVVIERTQDTSSS